MPRGVRHEASGSRQKARIMKQKEGDKRREARGKGRKASGEIQEVKERKQETRYNGRGALQAQRAARAARCRRGALQELRAARAARCKNGAVQERCAAKSARCKIAVNCKGSALQGQRVARAARCKSGVFEENKFQNSFGPKDDALQTVLHRKSQTFCAPWEGTLHEVPLQKLQNCVARRLYVFTDLYQSSMEGQCLPQGFT